MFLGRFSYHIRRLITHLHSPICFHRKHTAWDENPEKRPPFSEILARLTSTAEMPANVGARASAEARKVKLRPEAALFSSFGALFNSLCSSLAQSLFVRVFPSFTSPPGLTSTTFDLTQDQRRNPSKPLRSQVSSSGYVADVLQTVRVPTIVSTSFSPSSPATTTTTTTTPGAAMGVPPTGGAAEQDKTRLQVQSAGGKAGGSPSRMKTPEKGRLMHQRERALLRMERSSDPSITTLPAHAKIKPLLQQSHRSSSDNSFQGLPRPKASSSSNGGSSAGSSLNSRKNSSTDMYSLV